MKIVINNTEFDYNIGCRLLKTKYGETPFNGLEDIWEDIIPMTFEEIVNDIPNIEQRRVAIGCLGIERLYKEVNPTLVSSETIKKKTTWINEKGELETITYDDTYELYRVEGERWGKGAQNRWGGSVGVNGACFVKCKDTSTDREYFIWIDAYDVYRTNNTNENWFSGSVDYSPKIRPIAAIAWTIQTNVKPGSIEEIVRQGDCIMIKTKPNAEIGSIRHLTEKEYRDLVTLES